MTEISNKEKPRFCSDCGLSLVRLDTWCISRSCGDCGRDVYFVRHGEGGGIKVEKGEKFHVPSLTLSLNPNDDGRFFRPGFESFLKKIFLEEKLDPKKIVERYKEIEKAIDSELNNLDCIKHCDLETNEGVEEASKILESEGLTTYWYNLA